MQFNLLSLVLLFIVTVIHMRHNYAGTLTSRLTSLFLFSVFFATLQPNLIITGLIAYVPHLFRTGTILGLLAAPLLYLITTTAISRRKLTWLDLLHLTPAILYVINFFPLFILGADEKLAIIKGQSPNSAIYSLSEGWLFSGTVISDFRILQVIFYLVITVRRTLIHKHELDQWNDEQFNWRPVILQLLAFVTFYLLPFMIRMGKWFGDSQIDTLQLSFAAANMILVIFFFSNPELMYGFRVLKPSSAAPTGSVPASQDSRVEVVVESSLPEVLTDQASERAIRRIARITKHLSDTKSFLSPEFGLSTLEKELGISGKLISQTIREGTGQNFSAFVNDLRISHVLEQLQSDPRWKSFTVETLAAQAGYRSPTSFYNNFKEKTGKTPREFIEDLG